MIEESNKQDKLNSEQSSYDLVTIGAGPAALTAAIYTGREEISTLLVEKGIAGGMTATTDWIDNYPGYADGIGGTQLAEEMRRQAERFGAKLKFDEVLELTKGDKGFSLKLARGGEVKSKAVLIAVGSNYKRLVVPGEDEYYARGVHYCVTCDGAFYKDRRVVIVGGGNTAIQGAISLAKIATSVDVIVRSKIRASEVLQRKLAKLSDRVTIHYGHTVDSIDTADNKVVGINLLDANQEPKQISADGVFVLIGLTPNTQFLSESGVRLDSEGFVLADSSLETNIPGLFVAGDARSGAPMQVGAATGDGVLAALSIRDYLGELDD